MTIHHRAFRMVLSAILFAVVMPCVLLFLNAAQIDSPVKVLPIDKYYIFANHTPRVFSHRGSTNLFPQNTLFAFLNSVELGADVLDMDVRLTTDGHVVLVHDSSTHHVAGEDLLVHESTLEELQQLDFGFTFTANEGKHFPYRGLGIKILTLREALEKLPRTALLNIELKVPGPGFVGSGGPLAETVCKLLRQFDASNRAIVMSFSDMAWLRFRNVCPEVATAPGPLGMLPAMLFSTIFGYFPNNRYLLPFSAFQPPASVTTRAFVVAARTAGRPVHVWTVNDAKEMQHMMDIKVDGIMSDRLDILLEAVGGQRGRGILTDQVFDDIPTGQACDPSVLARQPPFARMVRAGCQTLTKRKLPLGTGPTET